MMNIRVICTAIVLLSLTGAVAFGQPAIQSLDGTWADGVQMTINGSSFGAKVPAAPVLWDPVDGVPAYSGLTNGDEVPVRSDGNCDDCPWPTRLYSHRIEYYDTGAGVRVPGTAVYMVNKTGGFSGLGLNLSGAGEILYTNYWTMATKNLYDQGNGVVFNKLMRIWSSSNGTQGRTSWEVRFTMRYVSDGAGGMKQVSSYYGGIPGILADNQWSNFEATVYNQNITSSGGGRLTLDVDNVRKMTTPSDLASTSGPYDWIQAIGSSPHDSSRYEDGTYIYFGDIYVDNTVARVVIGNASTYSACTHKEIQIPVAWSANQVTFTTNTGSFAAGEPVWFYVFNEDDQHNENGWEVTQEPIMVPGVPGKPELIN